MLPGITARPVTSFRKERVLTLRLALPSSRACALGAAPFCFSILFVLSCVKKQLRQEPILVRGTLLNPRAGVERRFGLSCARVLASAMLFRLKTP